MLAYARALGVTYYAQNYASIIRQPLTLMYMAIIWLHALSNFLRCVVGSDLGGTLRGLKPQVNEMHNIHFGQNIINEHTKTPLHGPDTIEHDEEGRYVIGVPSGMNF